MNLGPAGMTPIGAIAQPISTEAHGLLNLTTAAQQNPAIGRGEQPTVQGPQAGDDTPQEIQEALLSLVRNYEIETDYVRRHHVRRWRKAEEFWRGNHHLFWDRGVWDWKTPFERSLDKSEREDLPPHQYAINLYQALGQSIIAALAQKPAKLQWYPVSARKEEDIQTAKTASDVAELIRRNNPADHENGKGAYLLWTQGIVGGYVRYVVDGGRYGYHDEPQWTEALVELLPDRYECPACGAYGPALQGGVTRPGEGEGTITAQRVGVPCPHCGTALGMEHRMPAEYATLPTISGISKVANGAERISIYGGLHLKLPPYAEELHDCPYLMLVEEQHKAQLRAAYPQKAQRINDPGSEGEDQYERLSRLELMDSASNRGTMPFASLVTYKRVWFRPSAFWAHNDEAIRNKLLQLFPSGCYCAFAGNEFLEAREENVDDYWVITKGLDGQGMYTPALGDACIPLNEQLNDDVNLFSAHRDMSSAPPILYDSRYINGEAFKKRRMTPASYLPVLIEGGSSVQLAQMMFQPKVGIDSQIIPDAQRQIEMAQFITGALPTIFGGGVPSLKTAAAYSMAREQALGRLALTWKKFREFQSQVMTLAIQCFVRNRSEDSELVVTARGGDGYDSRYVRLADLRGNAIAHPSADEDFPTTWGQIRDSLAQLLQARNPTIYEPYLNPVNRPILNRYLGVGDLIDPDEDNRSKQYREIDLLMQSRPVQQAVAGPIDHSASGRQQWIPSVATEPLVDDAAVHIQTIRAWAVSSDGIKAKQVNPAGYANVMAHLLMHQGDLRALEPQLPQLEGEKGGRGEGAKKPGAGT